MEIPIGLQTPSHTVFWGGFWGSNTSEGIWITERTNVADWDKFFSDNAQVYMGNMT